MAWVPISPCAAMSAWRPCRTSAANAADRRAHLHAVARPMTAKAAPAAEAQRRQGNAKEIQARIALRVGLPGLVFLANLCALCASAVGFPIWNGLFWNEMASSCRRHAARRPHLRQRRPAGQPDQRRLFTRRAIGMTLIGGLLYAGNPTPGSAGWPNATQNRPAPVNAGNARRWPGAGSTRCGLPATRCSSACWAGERARSTSAC